MFPLDGYCRAEQKPILFSENVNELANQKCLTFDTLLSLSHALFLLLSLALKPCLVDKKYL